MSASLITSVLLTACVDGPDAGVAVQPVVAQTDYTAAAGPSFQVQSGDTAPLNCVGPALASYQWVVESSSNLPISLSSPNTASTNFTAPIVPAPTQVTLVCRMTVTNTVAATATSVASTASVVVSSRVVVTINPLETLSTLVTTVTGNKTVAPGARLTLTANSGWFDPKGAAAAGPVINYTWSVGASAPINTIVTPAIGSSVVDVIIPTSIQSAVSFPVTVTTTSGAKTTQATVTVLVDPAGPVNFAITPQAQSVSGGAVVTLNATGGTNVFYQWTVVNGPTVPLGGASTSTVGFVAPKVTVATNMTLRVAIGYTPITVANPGIYFLEGVVTVNP